MATWRHRAAWADLSNVTDETLRNRLAALGLDVSVALRKVTSDYTIEEGVDIVLVDASEGDVVVTLQSDTERMIWLKKIDTTYNRVVIVPATGTIDGEAQAVLVTPHEARTIVYDGENWWIV